MERKQLTIFTDGSCYWKVRKGGCGIYIRYKDEEYFIQKGYCDTTISRCELRALLLALQSIDINIPLAVTIYSDSEYVVNGVKRLFEWTNNNWKGVSNDDLWKQVVKEIEIRKKMRLKVKWHKGHENDLSNPIVFGNTVADLLADYKNFEYYEPDKLEEL